jgi:tetratricopeptide (TPR) repeat protein
MLFAVGWVGAQADIDEVAEAEAAYDAGDYNTAIALYESILASGGTRPEVYFNLGSAYFRSGALGRAMLNFRRAEQLTPRDSDLNQAMLAVRLERVDVQEDISILMDRTATLTAGVLTVRELSLLLFLLWVGLIGLGLSLFLRPQWRSSLTPFVLVLGVVFVALASLWANRAYVEQYRPLGVLDDETTFYSGASRDYLELFRLSPAAEVRVVEDEAGWGRAVLPDGRQGWVPLEQVMFVESPSWVVGD